MHKPFARKMRQLSNLRKRIIKATNTSLCKQLLIRYQRLLNYLVTRLTYRKLARFLIIPGLFVFQSQDLVQAQNFSTPPIDLSNADLQGFARPVAADIDGDGDLDIFYSDYETESMAFVENISTGDELEFADPTIPSFFPSEFLDYGFFAMGDLDEDGDLDVVFFRGSYDDGTQMVFNILENVGTATDPQFADGELPIVVEGTGIMLPNLADLDADGDLDLVGALSAETYDGTDSISFVYFENTDGIFGPQQTQGPLNLAVLPGAILTDLTVGDLDLDGDMDVLSFQGGEFPAGQYFFNYFFHENTGTAESPLFAAPVASPFGLMFTTDTTPLLSFPHLVDLDMDGDLDVLAYQYDPSAEIGRMLFYENADEVMTSILQTDLRELQVYPNPVGNLLQIQADFSVESITIYTAAGKNVKVIEGNNGDELHQISVSGLSRGTYFGVISGSEMRGRIRFVKT